MSLPARAWSCPWPSQAQGLDLDEQTVLLRAVVGATGKASTVEILEEPGYGFGDAALNCAKQAKFEPARDSDGTAYEASSPKIRVRFRR